jgi:hypothetical protein
MARRRSGRASPANQNGQPGSDENVETELATYVDVSNVVAADRSESERVGRCDVRDGLSFALEITICAEDRVSWELRHLPRRNRGDNARVRRHVGDGCEHGDRVHASAREKQKRDGQGRTAPNHLQTL